MASKQQMSGMRGVYLAAAELARRGYVVSPTSEAAAGADLLITDDSCQRAYSVQVKTITGGFNYWLLNLRPGKSLHGRICICLWTSATRKARSSTSSSQAKP